MAVAHSAGSETEQFSCFDPDPLLDLLEEQNTASETRLPRALVHFSSRGLSQQLDQHFGDTAASQSLRRGHKPLYCSTTQ